jgi:hypothetical protein
MSDNEAWHALVGADETIIGRFESDVEAREACEEYAHENGYGEINWRTPGFGNRQHGLSTISKPRRLQVTVALVKE